MVCLEMYFVYYSDYLGGYYNSPDINVVQLQYDISSMKTCFICRPQRIHRLYTYWVIPLDDKAKTTTFTKHLNNPGNTRIKEIQKSIIHDDHHFRRKIPYNYIVAEIEARHKWQYMHGDISPGPKTIN